MNTLINFLSDNKNKLFDVYTYRFSPYIEPISRKVPGMYLLDILLLLQQDIYIPVIESQDGYIIAVYQDGSEYILSFSED